MRPTVMDDYKAKSDEAKVIGIVIIVFICMLIVSLHDIFVFYNATANIWKNLQNTNRIKFFLKRCMYEKKMYFCNRIVPATLPAEQRTRAGRYILLKAIKPRFHIYPGSANHRKLLSIVVCKDCLS